MGESLVERQNVSIFGVDIEQVGLVRPLMAIADAVPHDDCAKPVLNRIDGARADATARRASAENNGVNSLRMKRWRKAGAEECAGILLGDDKFARRSAAAALIGPSQYAPERSAPAPGTTGSRSSAFSIM
jgi:hypothetical protein